MEGTMSALRRLALAVLVIASSGEGLAQGIDGARSPAWRENPPSLVVPSWPARWPVASRNLPAPGDPIVAIGTKQATSGILLGRGQRLSTGGAAPIRFRDLAWRSVDGGGMVARLQVSAEGAAGMRLAIEIDEATTGAEMRFVEPGPAGRVLGPMSLGGTAGLRWGPLTFGDRVTVEVFLPPGTDLTREAFTIDLVSRLDTDPLAVAKALGSAGSCERDVACFSLSGVAKTTAEATTLAVVTNSAGLSTACTATLMNSDPYSGKPYLLTGADCVSDQGESSSLNTLWNFQATGCGSNASRSTLQRTGGATLLARTASPGIAFLLMNDQVPIIASFSGWDPGNPAVGQSVMTIHHPQSDFKKLSLGSITAVDSLLSVRFGTGATEPGSVGAGLYVNDQYLTGVLYGGASSCSNPGGLDTYVPFSRIWATVGSYLRPAATPAPAAINYSDLWWNPSESGWGVTIADHETQLFVVWYTYDASGRPTWFVIPGGTFSPDRRTFTGAVYQTRGPCYRNAAFDPSQVTITQVGSATLDFAPPDLQAGWAKFSGTIGGTSWSKAITRQPFGSAAPDWGTDFTDIWWNSAESGWGLTLSQHGNNVFGVLFTYDCDGSPLFVVLPGVTFQSPSAFSGTLYTTSSGAGWWGSPSFDPAGVTVTPVGTSSIAFNGRNGQFSYTINGSSRSRPVGQQPFGNGGPTTPSPTKMLTVSLGGTGSGSVASSPPGISCGATCSASFTNGAIVVLTASPSAGSTFSGWSGDCSGTGNCTVTMSASRSVTANFQGTSTQTLAVSLSGTGSGVVTSSPAGINCGAACVAGFASGTSVVLTASASPGSRFVGWGGDCASAGSGSCTVVMSAARNAFAIFNVFAPPSAQVCNGQYSMTVNIAFMGCVNATHTFAGSLTINGINFDDVSSNAPSQFAGTLTVSRVANMFAGYPGVCTPVNLREAQVPFTGFMNISRIGSADATVLGEELHFQFSLGSMNTVLGTITGPEVIGGNFSCNY
jgi:lysyl endopeptidase